MTGNERIEAVYDVLAEQAAVLEALLALSREKRGAVLQNDTERLTEIVGGESRALSRMAKAEKRWAAVLPPAWEALGLTGEPVTLRVLIEHAEGEQRARLSSLHGEISATLDALKAQNTENGQLVEAQLAYTDMMLGLLGGSADPLNNFYGTDGRASDLEMGPGASLFDAEI